MWKKQDVEQCLVLLNLFQKSFALESEIMFCSYATLVSYMLGDFWVGFFVTDLSSSALLFLSYFQLMNSQVMRKKEF